MLRGVSRPLPSYTRIQAHTAYTYTRPTQIHAPYTKTHAPYPSPFLHEARALGDQVPQALDPRRGGLIYGHFRSGLLAPRPRRRCHLHRGGRQRRRLLTADILTRRRSTAVVMAILLLLKLLLQQPLPRRVPRGPEVLLRRQELLVQLPARPTHETAFIEARTSVSEHRVPQSLHMHGPSTVH